MGFVLRRSLDFVKKYRNYVIASAVGISIYKREGFGNIFYFYYHSAKANNFAKKKMYSEAIHEYDLIIEKNPATRFEKAEYLKSIGRLDEAILEMEKMIIESKYEIIASLAYGNKANYLIEKKEYSEALDKLTKMTL
eukprot:gene6267-10274_t